jgi:hypothetical protein
VALSIDVKGGGWASWFESMRGSHPLILGEMALIKDLHTAILIHFRVPRSGQNAQIGHFGLFFESTHFLSLSKDPVNA